MLRSIGLTRAQLRFPASAKPGVRGQPGTLGARRQLQTPVLPWQRPTSRASCRASGLDSCLAFCDHRTMGQGWRQREGWALRAPHTALQPGLVMRHHPESWLDSGGFPGIGSPGDPKSSPVLPLSAGVREQFLFSVLSLRHFFFPYIQHGIFWGSVTGSPT